MKNLTKALGIAGITALSFLPMKSEGQTTLQRISALENYSNAYMEKITFEDYNISKRKYGKVSLSLILKDSINLKFTYMNMRYGLNNQFKVKDVEGYLIKDGKKEEVLLTKKDKRELRKVCESLRNQSKGLSPGIYTPGNGISNLRGNSGKPLVMEAIF